MLITWFLGKSYSSKILWLWCILEDQNSLENKNSQIIPKPHGRCYWMLARTTSINNYTDKTELRIRTTIYWTTIIYLPGTLHILAFKSYQPRKSWANWGREKWSTSLEFMQLISSRVRIWTWIYLSLLTTCFLLYQLTLILRVNHSFTTQVFLGYLHKE